MVRHLKVAAWCILAGLTLSLIACSDDDSPPPPPPPLSVTGTVSDSAQAPVNGATVTAYNSTGALVASTTTNAVGRYAFYGLPTSAALTFKVTGPAGTFPAQAEKVSLAAGVVSLLDFYLPSSDPATEAVAIAPNLWESSAQLEGPRRAYLELASAPATAPTVTLAPVDVSQIGDGFPTYSVSPLAIGVDEIFELYAAAAFSYSGTVPAGTTLYLPIPQALDAAALAAAGPALYRFNEATAAWVAEAAVPAYFTDPTLGNFFTADVTQPGYYRVGQVYIAKPATGTLLYQTSTGTVPAAGVTVYLTGSNYGYQQVVVTDAQGQFTGLVKDDPAATNNFTFTAWGYGVELSETVAEADFTPTHTLSFPKPAGTATAAILKLDDGNFPPVIGSDQVGLIVASGRIRAIESAPPNFTEDKADVTFVVNTFDMGTGTPLSINATTKGSGIQTGVAGQTFANTPAAPTNNYATGFASIPIPTTIPSGGLLVFVQTSAGYAKISIDSVTETPALSGNWVITFRSAFSLSNSF